MISSKDSLLIQYQKTFNKEPIQPLSQEQETVSMAGVRFCHKSIPRSSAKRFETDVCIFSEGHRAQRRDQVVLRIEGFSLTLLALKMEKPISTEKKRMRSQCDKLNSEFQAFRVSQGGVPKYKTKITCQES